MPNKTMKTKIQVRRDTTANWLTNKDVVPAAGEPCFDLELGTLKIGDGVTSYENLKEISGGQAAHYEGVKGDGESDTDVISRVLTAAGAEAQKDDIFVVKALIAGGKYSYTAYVYDGSVWAAMDGNYSAENVYFADDLTYTAAIGVLTVPSRLWYDCCLRQECQGCAGFYSGEGKESYRYPACRDDYLQADCCV